MPEGRSEISFSNPKIQEFKNFRVRSTAAADELSPGRFVDQLKSKECVSNANKKREDRAVDEDLRSFSRLTSSFRTIDLDCLLFRSLEAQQLALTLFDLEQKKKDFSDQP
ncbi:venom prothrombin activator notecarin-D2 [Striga asiatica]|uniref:Venom prothrombin activator notecarin-D2 n=1 Tax=Striga asiatica TaxID=4170 RepID=A0A5A7QJX1_STRAF|nr:venom prothrombin activator notecarin-D2 [Striga asiatica]